MLDRTPSYYGPSFGQILVEALDSLRMLGRRSLLGLSGIAIGCASVVALLNIGHNAANEAIRAFKGMGSDILIASFPAVSEVRVHPAPATLDTEAAIRALPDILNIAPAALFATTGRLDGRSYGVSVIGTTVDIADALDLKVSHGRFLSRFDRHTTYVVIGANVARGFNPSSTYDPLGRRIQIGNYLFEIIGILNERGHNPLLPVAIDDAVILPIEGMRRIASAVEVNSIIARGRQAAILEDVASALREYLVPLTPGREVFVQIPKQLLDGMARQTRTFSYLLVGLGGISLLAGGVGIMNVMVMNVSARRREIGIRMAVGARPLDIAMLFLLEAAVLTAAGALVGAVVGLASAWVFVNFSGWVFSLSTLSLPLGIFSSLVLGLFFGLHPAVTASRLEPVRALRDD
jgi:putative ABC transport system permease protein